MPTMAEAGVTVERRFAAPRELVWALLADTNRYDRALGLTPPRYRWTTIDGRHVQVGEATQNGVAMSWIEQPYEWVEGRWLYGRRRFISGPASEGGLRIEVDDDDDGPGCIARVTASGDARSWVLRALSPVLRAHLRRKLEGYVAAVADVVAAREGHVADVTLPAVAQAQHLLARLDNEVTSRAHSDVDQAELSRRAQRLRSAAVDPAIIERLCGAIARRPDEEVAQMRPFELARQWAEDRAAVLQAFLHGTRAGLVDLGWQINCPVCRVSAQVVDTLGDVGRSVHCEACNIEYGVDFGANVEAVFRCNRAIRAVEPAVYCAASPSFRPHVLAQLRVEPNATRTMPMHVDDGRLHLSELHALRLGCEVAVLSACDTNVGRIEGGEGVFALSRAFLAAGATNVVASLWRLNDRSTAILMGDFFRRVVAAFEGIPERAT